MRIIKKQYFFLLIITLLMQPCLGQVKEIKQLLAKAKTTKNEQSKADVYNRIAMLSHFRYRDSCLVYANKALDIAETAQYKKGIADALNCFGIFYMSSNNYLSAKYFKKALLLYKETGDVENQAQVYMNLGVLLFIDKNEPEAVKYIYRADNIISRIKKDSIRSIILSDIITLDKKLPDARKKAIFAKGFAIAQKYNDYPMIVSYENNRGTNLYNDGYKEEGIRILLESVKMADSIGCEYVKVTAYMTLGEMMFDSGRDAEGIRYYELGIEASQRFGYPERYQAFTERLYAYYKSKNNTTQAFRYANLLLEKQSEIQKRIQESGYNYVNYVSKEVENHELKIVQAYQEKAFYALAFLIVLLIMFLFIVWKLYRSKKAIAQIQLQLHEESIKRNKELEERDAFNSMLISVLAHDVRQPFYNIILAASLFDTGAELSEEEKSFIIKELEVTAKQSIFFMDGVLAWIKSRKSGHAFIKEHINLFDLATEANSFFTAAQKEKQITFKMSIPKELFAESNRMVLSFVLRNLFNNATKYSPKGATIEVAAYTNSEKIVLSIKDNGRGMTPEQQFQLFQPVQDTGNHLPDKGAGVALTMSHEMLKQLGATLSVVSELNEGSTFFITIANGVTS